MPLGGFGFLSLFYMVLGVRFATQFWPQRRAIFDRQLTHHDRSMIAQASFFFMLPVAVALHELGHAIAIWLFGGEVVDFGFYFFAGFVSYDPTGFSDTQQMLIAFAGTLVNMLLIVVAMGIVFFWNPPLRPAWNELLLQFSVISGLNAFIVYPLLDLASGLSGDWTQMYDGGVPWLTAMIIALQAAFIGAGLLVSRNPRLRGALAARTGVRRAEDRGLLGWGGPSRHASSPGSRGIEPNAVEKALNSAAARVASGWGAPVSGRLTRLPDGSALALQWERGGMSHIVLVSARGDHDISISGARVTGNGAAPPARTLAAWDSMPSEDELTLALRIAMEQVDQTS